MKPIATFFHTGLCLLLSLQLLFPATSWTETGSRDLVVEDMKDSVALWVLAIGVSKYADERISLQYADHDAQKIAQLLKTQEGLLFNEVFTQVLVNEQATREGILQSMSRFLGQASEEDVVLIFLAGHGLQDRQTDTYYFVPHNASTEDLIVAGLPMPMFDEVCKRLQRNVRKLILWLDTCHAGAMSVAARGVNAGEDLAEALSQAEGQYVLSASKAGEESYENEQYRFEGEDRAHGAFTYSLLRGLQGEAADEGGVVWISDLFSHVSKEVPRLTEGKQHPYSQGQGTNMPLFVVHEKVASVIGAPAVVPGIPGPGVGLTSPKKGSKKWLWLIMGAAAVGGTGAVLATQSSPAAKEPATGNISFDVQVP